MGGSGGGRADALFHSRCKHSSPRVLCHSGLTLRNRCRRRVATLGRRSRLRAPGRPRQQNAGLPPGQPAPRGGPRRPRPAAAAGVKIPLPAGTGTTRPPWGGGRSPPRPRGWVPRPAGRSRSPAPAAHARRQFRDSLFPRQGHARQEVALRCRVERLFSPLPLPVHLPRQGGGAGRGRGEAGPPRRPALARRGQSAPGPVAMRAPTLPPLWKVPWAPTRAGGARCGSTGPRREGVYRQGTTGPSPPLPPRRSRFPREGPLRVLAAAPALPEAGCPRISGPRMRSERAGRGAPGGGRGEERQRGGGGGR